jgi:nicotinamide riboside kinase
MAERTKVLVVEGPDDSGKSTFVKRVVKDLNFVEFVISPKNEREVVRVDPRYVASILSAIRKFDKSKVYVVDRAFVTDVVYDKVLRDEEAGWARTAWLNLVEHNDVQLVVLDHEATYPDNYRDHKTGATGQQQTSLCTAYRQLPLEDFHAWHRTLVWDDRQWEGGQVTPVLGASDRLVEDLRVRFDLLSPKLLQECYADSAWGLFVSCVCLNRAAGRVARKVIPEILYHFNRPRLYKSISLDWIESMCRPLGFQRERAAKIWQMGQRWDAVNLLAKDDYRKLEGLPGVGKYAMDSFRMFILGHREGFEEPFDVKLKERLEDLVREEGERAAFERKDVEYFRVD